jgi:hypothetical protein
MPAGRFRHPAEVVLSETERAPLRMRPPIRRCRLSRMDWIVSGTEESAALNSTPVDSSGAAAQVDRHRFGWRVLRISSRARRSVAKGFAMVPGFESAPPRRHVDRHTEEKCQTFIALSGTARCQETGRLDLGLARGRRGE